MERQPPPFICTFARHGFANAIVAATLLLSPTIAGASDGSSAAAGENAVSLDPRLSPEEYDLRAWSMAEGLPSNRVHDVVQTRDGYLWVATERGLARFDGVKVTTFNRSNVTAFVTNQVTSLIESRDGGLWIGTAGGGLLRCRPGQPPEFERFPELDGLRIQSLCEDLDGTLWVGTEVKTWTVTDGHCAPRPDAPLNVRAICEDGNGKLWFGSAMWMVSRPPSPDASEVEPKPGLYRLDGDRFYRLTAEDGFAPTEPDHSVTALCPDHEGGLWVGTLGRDLLHYREGKWTNHAESIDPRVRWHLDLHQDRSGQLWIGTFASGCHRLSGSEASQLPVGISPLRCFAEDRDGNIWYGAGPKGLGCISNPELSRVRLDAPGARMRCVMEDSAGDLWFGSGNASPKNGAKSGLHRLRDGAFENFGTDDGLPTHLVTGFAEGPDGRMWIGTYEGLVCRAGEELTTFTTADGMGRDWIRAVHVDRSGVVWIGFWEGSLQRFHAGKFTTIEVFGDADVNWFHEDAEGMLWIGSNRGLWKWREGNLVRVTNEVFDGLPTTGFTAFGRGAGGVLWLGTDGGGLCRYADGRVSNWTSAHGLHDDLINAIVEDTRGRLWLGGPHGLTSLPVKALDDLAAGTIERVEARVHPVRRGNAVVRIGGDYQPRVLHREDGSIYCVTGNGAFVIPPDGPYSHPLPPLVQIEDVHVKGEPRGANAAIEVASGFRHIDIHYTANTFAAPERARFRYRLDGYDDDWIDAGQQRYATYTNIAPGDYVFQVAADNGHGVWSEREATIAITVVPRWWERTWLRVAALLGFVAAGAGYSLRRIRAAHRSADVLRHEIKERERAEEETRVQFEALARVQRAVSLGEVTASIAHEVKQPIFAIVSNAQTAERLLGEDNPDIEEIREALHDISCDGNRAADVIDHIRAAVAKEDLPRERLDFNEVTLAAVKLAKPELIKRGLTVRTELAESLPPVEGDMIELQQVVLNLIINGGQAMDESAGENVLLLKTSEHDGFVELAVVDTGVGFSDAEAEKMFEAFYTTKLHGTGMGLAIDRTIVEAHGGRIWAELNPDRGATFYVSLPVVNGGDVP